MAAYREPMSTTERAPISSQTPHSPWHSPVPYLFGGLAAMLGLIAFALLILACSYWKLSGYLEGNGESERDLEAGDGANETDQKPQKVYEEKILVIMAGQEKPTFLATPSMSSSTGTSRSSSFGDNNSTCTCDQNQKSKENMNDDEDDDDDSTVKLRSSGETENDVRRTESVERTATETTTETTRDENV
ncbi:protein GLUTAMINE DUMPER 3 [Vicia villosa]|uniref:protein GLUTAMINE DUMPER 3 n=1 Tax=Vicia villosa TaxID=3911 RepID=UPI00273BF9C6|nr:protein GLUTAMINE DUMPER 3 [Vicia villosa]